MKTLSRTELAIVKRTAMNVKSSRIKRAKLEAKIAELTAELESCDRVIDAFEQPVITMTGGFTSEQVLAGEMELPEVEEINLESVSEDEKAPETEVMAGDYSPVNELAEGTAVGADLPFEV